MNQLKFPAKSLAKFIFAAFVSMTSIPACADTEEFGSSIVMILPCDSQITLHPNALKDFADDWGNGESDLALFKSLTKTRIQSSIEKSFPNIKIVGNEFCADSNKQVYFARTEDNDRVIFEMPKALDSVGTIIFAIQNIEFAIRMKEQSYIIMNGAGTASGSGTSYKTT